MLTTNKVRAKVLLHTKNQEALSILYVKLLGIANHETTDVENEEVSYLLDFNLIPHFFKVLIDYSTHLVEVFPNEKPPEIVSIEIGGEAGFNDLQQLFTTPETVTEQIVTLTKKVEELEERLNVSKVQFFDYQQYHRIPGVIHLICQAINRQDIVETLISEIADDQLFSFSKKH